MFSREEIQQLKTMYIKEFGEEIADEYVVECAQTLLNLLTAIYKHN